MSEDLHILLVNNASETRLQLRSLLEKAGHPNISEAACSRSASQILRSLPVDLLITEIDIPGLDGWRLSRLVRSGVFKCKSDIPIIVVAKTWCERIAETTAREFGVNAMLAMDHLPKLGQVVRNCLSLPEETLRRPRALVVEDNPDTAEIARRVLRHRFEVEIAVDGSAGLAAWTARRHDLVLLDTMLPEMSGPEVLREILRIDPSQPVVVMTAFSSVDLAEDLMLEGAADFIAKPFLADQLRRVCELATRREDYLVSNAQFASRVNQVKERTEAYRKISEDHQRLLDNLNTIVLELDQNGEIQFLNRAWTKLTGFSLAYSLNKPLAAFLPQDVEGVAKWLQPLLEGKIHESQGELRLLDKQGEALWVEYRLGAVPSADRGRAIFGCLDDISERKRTQKQVEYLSMHDSLTGLHNRHYFENELRRLAATSARGKGSHALVFLDLDHFKVINDNFGHQHGDALLRELGQLLKSRLRLSDTLCRLGGDEFGILIPAADKAQARLVAEEMTQLILGHRVEIDGQETGLSCSVGISEVNGKFANPEEYFKQADIALYVAKRRGRNRIQIYDPKDKENDELRTSLDWVRRLRRAVDEDRLKLYFQPVMHIASGKIVHYEALVRLDLPETGIALPQEFIPALERAGEMALLDHSVIRKAILHLKETPELQRVAVNLSAQAFGDEELVPLIEKQLRDQGVEPRRLMFELTESASIANIAATQRMIKQLNELGCEFAVDDFGTGFSTFGFLKQFPAEYVKVDGSFITHLDRDPIDQVLVRSMSEVARALNKKTVAEFVHNENILNLVQSLGIDYAQGFHIGKPLPLAELQFPPAPLLQIN
ncbi:two-component system response regulator [Geoalkalibacter sp.]|uniref:two-component system response regulator n=1 Tax=Geoalkalibacter sp. TaxID=3041440 RepID=UPI00272E0F2B|nr:EAL domain-containing protein [Geoalkalibacter sp.]